MERDVSEAVAKGSPSEFPNVCLIFDLNFC